MHGGFIRLGVESWLCVGKPVSGKHHLLLNQKGLAVSLDKVFGSERYLASSGCRKTVCSHAFLVDQADFQTRSAPEDVLRLGGVLNARKLHDDAICALLLNQGFCDAEFIDTVMQRGDVLLDRKLLNALDRVGLQR